MFIQTETTPNPEVIKFLPGEKVSPDANYDFTSASDAKASPLANALFAQDGVAAVFLGADFISVTKLVSTDWQVLKPHILSAIMDHYLSGLPIVEGPSSPISDIADTDSDIVAQIKAVLDERVRPAVAMDGGDVVFERFEDGVVYLHMRGACAGCPSAGMTLKVGIERMLCHFIPEVKEVKQA